MGKRIKTAKTPLRSNQVPATAAMLYAMEDRLNHKMAAGLQGVHSEIHGVKSEMHGMKSELHRVALLVEEQNARNKYVMDGYAQLYDLVAKIAK